MARISRFNVMSSVAGSTGHGRYDQSNSALDALVGFDDGTSAIANIDGDGNFHVVARTGREQNGLILTHCGMPSSPGFGKPPVALVDFTTSEDKTVTKRGVLGFEDTFFYALVGSPAPGTDSEKFLEFKDPVAGTHRYSESLVAFEASLAGGPKETNRGIWLARGSSEPYLIARKGMPAPGAPGKTFAQFRSLSIIDDRGGLFTASLSPGNGFGCWATDSNGSLVQLLRTGDAIEGRVIRSFDILNTVRGSEGQRRAWAGTLGGGVPLPKVIFRARFTDGTEGIMVVTLP